VVRAIAASLQDIGSSHEATGSSNQPITIDDSDDDDIVEILDARTAASPKTEVVPIPVKPDPEPQVPTPQPTSSLQSTNIPAAQSSFLSERAKLEQARLERLKRLRPDTVSPQPTPSKRAKSSPPSSETESEEDAPPPPK
jgi:tyrosyl-DNA phosphodiesterase-1